MSSSTPSPQSVAVQQDGDVLVGGSVFTGQDLTLRPNSLIRLKPNGVLDTRFMPPISGACFCVRTTPDGFIILGGELKESQFSRPQTVFRLTQDGRLDSSFQLGHATDGIVRSVAAQKDGRILMGGIFSVVGQLPRRNLARLNQDGTVDTSFDPGKGVYSINYNAGFGQIFSMELDQNDRIVVAGMFEMAGDAPRGGIARFHPDGSLDESFAPALEPDSVVNAARLQVDGRILIGGSLHFGSKRGWALRLNPDGSLDPSFQQPSGPGDAVDAKEILVQPDGRILIASQQQGLGTTPGFLLRLLPDGQLDPWFGRVYSNVVDGAVREIALQPNGQILAVGEFLSGQGQARPGIARIRGGDPEPQPPTVDFTPQILATNGGAYLKLSARVLGYPSPQIQWIHNGVPMQGETNLSLLLDNVGPSDGGDYSVLARNALGELTSRVATVSVAPTMTTPGASDLSFVPPLEFFVTQTMVEQADCKIVVGTDRSIFRMTAAGKEDHTFNRLNKSSGIMTLLNGMTSDRNGNLLVAGALRSPASTSRISIARFSPDGEFDLSFIPPEDSTGRGVRVAVDRHGRVYLARSTPLQNGSLASLIRLKGDGMFDPDFRPVTNVVGVFEVLMVQPDDKVILGGSFSDLDGHPVQNLGRVDPSGAIDTTFLGAADGPVLTAAARTDGKILWGGSFSTFGGAPYQWLARTDGDGVVDPTFAAGSAVVAVKHLALNREGGLLTCNMVTGAGYDFGKPPLSRFDADGMRDPGFDSGPGFQGMGLRVGLIDSCGHWVVGGDVRFVGGIQRAGLSRIHLAELPHTGPVILQHPRSTTQNYGEFTLLAVAATGQPLFFQWYRDGQPIYGANKSSVLEGNWDPNTPRSYFVVVSNSVGTVKSEDAVVRSIGQPPQITLHPRSQQLWEGQGASLLAAVTTGNPKPALQWRRNGKDLAGETNMTLFLTEVHPLDSGNYSLVASNSGGSATSVVARLLVVPAVPVNEALNTTNWVWISPLGAAWEADVQTSADSVASAGSGPIQAVQPESAIQTRLFGPGTLAFRWKVSSRTNTHFLALRVNGVGTRAISGEVDWTQSSIPLAKGVQDVRWIYTKLSAEPSGKDRGWLDQVTFTPSSPRAPAILLQPASQRLTSGSPLALSVYAEGIGPLHHQWSKDGSELTGATQAVFRIPSLAVSDAGRYSVTVRNAFGNTPSLDATLEVHPGAPRLDSPTWVAPRTLRFQLIVGAGTTCRVEFSDDLASWNLLRQFTSEDPSTTVEDELPEGIPHRFYRALADP